MKKTKFEILIFICMILFGLGCFLIATKNNQYNFFEDILSRYPEENIAGTLMVDLTHDGNDELLVISQDALEITVEIYAIIDSNLEIFSFNQKGQKEILETEELPYDSIHTSEDNKQDLLIKTQNFKAIYEKWQTNSIPLITIGSDPLTGDNDNYVLEKKSNIE